MRKELVFTKAVASGNDFIILNRPKFPASKLNNLAIKLCDRKYGIGSDGLLVLEKADKKIDFLMRIFNPDGTEAEMCGNGVRCASLYWNKFSPAKPKKFKIKTMAGIIESQVFNNTIKVKMTEPKHLRLDVGIKFGANDYNVHYIDTGVPHIVLFTEDLKQIDVNTLGRNMRFHGEFKPKGTNVDFVSIVDNNNIKIRTYERGVEAETLACGTGSVASSIVTALVLQLKGKRLMNVETTGGEILKVYFDVKDNKICDVWLEGKVNITFKGQIMLEDIN